ncbi:MAG: hypothetical protein M0P31_11840 [Solirubrobacteraceae bacterium]|nr:hypothetical protein [Solirubrobacteraceae bacterium]
MARLKLSPSGLRGPLDLADRPVAPAVVEPVAADVAPTVTDRRPARPATPPVPSADAPAARPVAPAVTTDAAEAAEAVDVAESAPTADEAPAAGPAPTADEAPAAEPAPTADEAPAAEPAATVDAEPVAAAPDAPAAADTDPGAPIAAAPTADTTEPTVDAARAAVDDLPGWTVGLPVARLRPDRLLGRPKQTAMILDRDLSERADTLVAATGPRVTFAAIVTAILHFHLPADGDAAARTIGGYRRRRLDALDHPWEERNARVPEGLRDTLDDVVAGATGRVASVRRSTLVNALLDAHLPSDPDEAARLVTRMEMVRGGAFLDVA